MPRTRSQAGLRGIRRGRHGPWGARFPCCSGWGSSSRARSSSRSSPARLRDHTARGRHALGESRWTASCRTTRAGGESVSIHGVALIALLATIGLCAWKGLRKHHEGFNAWAQGGARGSSRPPCSSRRSPSAKSAASSRSGFTGESSSRSRPSSQRAVRGMARRMIAREDLQSVAVGIVALHPPDLPAARRGRLRRGRAARAHPARSGSGARGRTNSVAGNLAGVAFGVVMYFPTLVEGAHCEDVPRPGHAPRTVARLSHGRPGAEPAVDPHHLGDPRAAQDRTYVGLVALFSTARARCGAWVDGARPGDRDRRGRLHRPARRAGRARASHHATPQGT